MNKRHILGRAFQFYRKVLLAGVALIGLVVGALTAVALIADSANQAVGDSIRADYGDKPYAIQVRNAEVALPAIAQVSQKLIPISETAEAVNFNGGLVEATIRSTDEPALQLGVAIEGQLPSQPGEIGLSVSLAAQLDAGVGDDVAMSDQSWSVTGIIVDPAEVDALEAVTIVELVEPQAATVWVADSDPFAWPELQDSFDSEALTFRTIDILVEDERASASTRYFVYANVIIGVLTFVLLIALSLYLPVLKAVLTPARVGLLAAGQSVKEVRTLAFATSAGVIFVGIAFGYASSAGFAYLLQRPLSNLVGQYWVRISLPIAIPLLVTVAAIILVLVLTASIFGDRKKVSLPTSLHPTNTRAWFAFAVNIIAATLVGLTLLGAIRFEIALFVILFAAITTPLAFAQLSLAFVGRFGGPSMRAGLSQAIRASLVLSIAIAVLTALGSAYAARAVHDDRTNQAGIRAQPTGSLALYQVPDNAVQLLQQTYASLSGDSVVDWILPDESGLYVRATRPALIECMSEAGIDDPFAALEPCGATTSDVNPDVFGSSIAIVVMSSSEDDVPVGASDAVQDGSIGIIQFDDSTGMAVDLFIADQISTDSDLGGTLPGLVVPVGGELAEDLSLRPSTSHLLLFRDFGSLSPQEQAQMRGAAARLAGGAQVAEDSAEEQGTARRIAIVVAVGSATFIGIMVGIAGVLISRSSRPLLILVNSVRTTRRARRLLSLGVFGTVSASAVFAAAWGLTGAWLIGVKDGLGFGFYWTLPPIAAVLVAISAAALWLRPPSMES